MPTVHRSAISDFGSISDQIGVYASVKALFQTRRRSLFYRFAYEEDMPKGASTTIKFRRWLNIAPSTAPIQGSTTPDPSKQDVTDITATIQQYGLWLPQPKHIEDTIGDPVLNRAINALSHNMRMTYEQIAYNILRMGANVFYATGSTSQDRTAVGTGAGNGVLTLAKLREVVESLEANDVEQITEMIHADIKIGTKPVEDCYIAVCHSDLGRTIRDLPGFLKPVEYAKNEDILPGEMGAVENVRFVKHNVVQPFKGAGSSNTNVKNTAGKADVYPILIFGKEAFGMTRLKGVEFNKILVANAQVTSADPLGQRGTAGWNGWFTTKILEDDYMARLEVTSPKA